MAIVDPHADGAIGIGIGDDEIEIAIAVDIAREQGEAGRRSEDLEGSADCGARAGSNLDAMAVAGGAERFNGGGEQIGEAVAIEIAESPGGSGRLGLEWRWGGGGARLSEGYPWGRKCEKEN